MARYITVKKDAAVERELLERGPVLDRKGRPNPGFSRKSVLVYDRKAKLRSSCLQSRHFPD